MTHPLVRDLFDTSATLDGYFAKADRRWSHFEFVLLE